MINKFTDKLNYLGIVSTLKCFWQTLVHIYCFFRFNFEKWHIQGGLHCSKRNQFIVNAINNLKVNSVVDVGCGLGVILNELNTSKLLGIDNSSNVIRAAESISENNNVTFLSGGFGSIQGDYDVLIATNFLHNYDKNAVTQWIEKAIHKNHIKFLVVDEIFDYIEGYRFKHRFINYIDNLELVESDDFVKEKRCIKIYQVNSK